MSQNAKLLCYLESRGSISTLEAVQNLLILRVSERIRELERLGYVFRHEPETTQGGARIMRYTLISIPQPSTAGSASAPSGEGVGQGAAAEMVAA